MNRTFSSADRVEKLSGENVVAEMLRRDKVNATKPLHLQSYSGKVFADPAARSQNGLYLKSG